MSERKLMSLDDMLGDSEYKGDINYLSIIIILFVFIESNCASFSNIFKYNKIWSFEFKSK